MSMNSNYRPDIDGLRAVAVLGVLFFHARLDVLPGGYVGVDVFFVISGYLITKIIISHEGSIGSFLGTFYERRIRRLIPAAVPVLAFTAFYAWYLLPQAALFEFAQSLVAYALFLSNWFFLSIAGYFDGPSHFKPLLHTWSLSVEEQFYILFPIPILLLMRQGVGAVRLLLSAVFILSLGYSVYLVESGDTDAAFFNSLARFWEIALGGLIAVGLIRAPRSGLARNALGIVGFAAIIASMVFFTGETTFPGKNALLPTLGAAAVILSAQGPVASFLSSRAMVGIGLISYSLYLWHWPLFVLVEYSVPGARPIHFLTAMLVSAALATASYFLIETPIRTRRALRTPSRISAAFVTSTIVIASFGAVIWREDGFPSRFPDAVEYLASRSDVLQFQAAERSRDHCWVGEVDMQELIDKCTTATPGARNRILLVGDSHAAQFYPAIKSLAENAEVSLLAVDSCTLRSDLRQGCKDLVAWLRERVETNSLQFDIVIMTARIEDKRGAELFANVAEAVGTVVPVVALGPIQHYNPDLPTMYPTVIGRLSRSLMEQRFSDAVQEKQFEVDQFLRDRFSNTAIKYVSLLDLLCPGGRGYCRHFDSDGLPITIDNSHLSLTGAQDIMNEIIDDVLPETLRTREQAPDAFSGSHLGAEQAVDVIIR